MKLLIFLLLVSSNCMSQNEDVSIEQIIKTPYKNYFADSIIHKKIKFDCGGSLWSPKGYSNTRTGTKDSEMGELKSEALLIHYDIGFSAGAHMGKHRIKDCSSYYDTSINGHRAWVGLIKDTAGSKLVVTIYNYSISGEPFSFPVNFWAIVKDKADMREVLKIIFSYKPKQQ